MPATRSGTIAGEQIGADTPALGCDSARLPFTLSALIENLLRGEDAAAGTRAQIEADAA